MLDGDQREGCLGGEDGGEDAGELVGAGGAAKGAVDSGEGGGSLSGIGPFEQAADGLEVAVAAADVAEVVDAAVGGQVEVYLLRADECRGFGGDVTHAASGAVADDFEVVSCHV